MEKVLFNINRDIKQKTNAQWYTSLNHTLYSPLEKNSVSFAKIKLTQEFIEEDSPVHRKSMKSKQGPARLALINKFITKHRKLEPLMKLVLAVGDVSVSII